MVRGGEAEEEMRIDGFLGCTEDVRNFTGMEEEKSNRGCAWTKVGDVTSD